MKVLPDMRFQYSAVLFILKICFSKEFSSIISLFRACKNSSAAFTLSQIDTTHFHIMWRVTILESFKPPTASTKVEIAIKPRARARWWESAGVSISIFLVQVLILFNNIVLYFFLIYCDTKVFVRAVSSISCKLPVSNSICLESSLALSASYDIFLFLSYVTTRVERVTWH